MITAARFVSSEESSARTALKLGPKSIAERFRNLELDTSGTMPAIERYTGVLYDPLGAQTADDSTRSWWFDHVVVQSAMFGPIGAGDPIPAYRLSHDSRLGILRLASHWPAVVVPGPWTSGQTAWSSTSGRRATASSVPSRARSPRAS